MSGISTNGHGPLIISGYSSQELASDIAFCLGTKSLTLGRQQFSNKEIRLTIEEHMRAHGVVVVASAAGDPNKNIIETAMLLRAANNAGAAFTTLFHPGLPYARADGTWGDRGIAGLEVVIDFWSPHCDNSIILDPHNPDITSTLFRRGNPHHICITPHSAFPIAIQLNFLIQHGLIDPLLWKPTHADVGSSKRISKDFKKCMEVTTRLTGLDNFAQAFKDRDSKKEIVTITSFSQDVAGMDVVVFEDMIDRGSTIVELTRVVKGEKKARSLTVFATAGIFSADENKDKSPTAAIERINNSGVDAVFVTDSYQHLLVDQKIGEAIAQSPIIHQLEIAPYSALFIHALHAGINDQHPRDNSISAILKGTHPRLIDPCQTIARPVALKPGNPLLRLKAA